VTFISLIRNILDNEIIMLIDNAYVIIFSDLETIIITINIGDVNDFLLSNIMRIINIIFYYFIITSIFFYINYKTSHFLISFH